MEEFKVKSASNSSGKKYNLFKLHKDDTIMWNDAKMRRETNNQPWQIKYGSGRTGRRFKAIKEGGVNENASYFVFFKSNQKSDTYEVCPVEDWYSVSATQRYKTLTAEEAEQKFEQRHKMLNLFSVMHLKKNGENDDEAGGSSGQGSRSFKVSELDDWDNSGDDDGSGREDENGDDEDKKKARRKKNIKQEKDEDDAPEEGKEESDEGDFEQREVDYMSDSSSMSSDDQEEKRDENDVKGIAEEEALRDLLSTDDEEDADNPQQKPRNADGKSTLGAANVKKDPDDNSSEESDDSDDYDVDEEKMDTMFMKKGLPAQLTMAKQEDTEQTTLANTRPSTSSSNKRKLAPETSTPTAPPPQPKRPCQIETSSSQANGQEKIVEDLVKKYLSRKPMTIKNLLKEIKSKFKRTVGAQPEMEPRDLVSIIASVIKRLDPEKQKINDLTYLYLKPT